MAVIAKQRYKLDIAPKGGWVIVYVSQHDNGAREIEFEITNQGNAFSIPASINVSVQGIKSNKSYFSHSCSYSGNIVTMALADDMTDVIGKAICVLKFTNQSNQKLATAKFVLNVDTDSSSEGVIIDTEAEEIFNQMLNDIRAQAASISVDIAELQSMVGSPLVASTVSAMTDHNKIYVYTGSESGYINGNWYYWNGSAWTSGGVYNSTAFETDPTLSQPGQAADSKAVGDRFEGITARTRNIADIEIGRYSFNGNTGVISHKPSNANILGLSDKIACEPETEYAASLYTANDLLPITFYVAFYSETEYLSQIYIPNRTRIVVKTPANTKYFCVYWYKGTGIPFDDNTHIQIEEGYISTEYIAPTSGYDVVARQGETVNIPYTEHKGYFNSSGTIAVQTSSKEYYTEKIDLALFKSIGASVEYPTEQSLWFAYATYDENGDFIERVILANLTNTRAYGQSINVNNNVRYIAFTYRKFDDGILKIFGSLSESGVAAKIISHSATKASFADGFQFRFKPCYDHLFVNKSAENTVIPHESLYHVRISKALGFNIIEANIASTSDGVYIVNHLNRGKFGGYFHHADGQTDISDIAVSSVTWDWICQNARYNSTLKKYQTRPSRVEEFLSECRQQNIIPFIYSADPAVLEIADNYMGKNNYIAYNAEREKCPTAIIYRWAAETSKEGIIEYCEKVGKPLIYGMSNPTAFTDAELREIIDALHTRGFWIGCSYVDYDWHKYSAMGIDLNGTQSAINRMQCGNLYNFDTLLSFDDFNVTGASEVDGELVFSTNGTIEPDINDTILSLGAVDIEISFSGTITMHGIGERTVAYTYTSDGTLPFFVATPIIGGSPKFTADVTSGTIVKDIKYKASKL